MSTITTSKNLHYIDPLTDKNFASWKQRMILVLQDRGLWKYVDGSKPAPDPSVSDKGREAWEEKDQQAKAQIILAVSDSVLPIVRHVKTSMEAWTKILSVYELNSLSQQVSLRRQLTNLRFNTGQTMQDHLNNIQNLVDRLHAVGVHVKDDELAIITLCSLPTPSSYDPLIVTMEGLPPNELTFLYVSTRLLAEYTRQMEISESTSKNSVLITSKSSRQRPRCTHCEREGHIEANCWELHPEKNPHKKEEINLSKQPENLNLW